MLKTISFAGIIFIAGFVQSSAQSNDLSQNQKSHYLYTKAAEIRQTQETALLELKGKKNKVHTVELPVIEKVVINKEPLISINNDLRLDGDMSSVALTRELAQMREVENLSQKLGVEIENKQYLSLYREAASWLGTRYRRGSMGVKGVDCSGFTSIIYNKVFDKQIPRTSRGIANQLSETLLAEDLLPGDLVFFATRGKKYINHVGVYLGNDCFVHASIKGGVMVNNLNETYYKRSFQKAGRL